MRKEQIAAGVRDSFSAGLGIFPLGIAFGLLVVQAGLSWWLAPALSLAAFAGSLELLLVGMMASVTPLAAVALTVLVVDFRHVFYAFWVGGGLVGVAIGTTLPAPVKGLEFALCALFTVLTLDAFRSRREILAIVFAITLALRAVPFALLRTLRGSAIVRRLSAWMPVGILAILAVTALHGTIAAEPRATLYALLAVAVTAGCISRPAAGRS
ncbi:AzlC family ABC transporter permease [Nonomuraea angiospora]|uniref:AzlC family ABC transporter permease n=1 Tax=Nonomuraea angiospora TaxID=46172 RepID=UPI0029B665F5|nr:AzlC family ABC transporter permease [Nonomuraea angiospora]MDX3109542.1 AzlC family ABC transporter permease [Nonomuraea angiospora]